MKQEKLLTISEASELLDLDVAKSTLRRWEENGKLILDIRTKGGQKRYKLSSLLPEMKNKNSYNRKTIAYARVSFYNQKD
jgi:predicted site-specific integrase-resolvase